MDDFFEDYFEGTKDKITGSLMGLLFGGGPTDDREESNELE